MLHMASTDRSKLKLLELLTAVKLGHLVLLTDRGKPVTCTVPYAQDIVERVPGNDAGQGASTPDYDAPRPAFEAT